MRRSLSPVDPGEARRTLDDERRRLVALSSSLERTCRSDASGGSSAEPGVDAFEREKELAVLHQVRAQLAEVEAARLKLDQGTYGRCELCGGEIDPARLRARPAARFCLRDQERIERANPGPEVGLSAPS
ncbi:MAG TPA: TraR/DksA C4-type zinc finger protein [Actinomycetota bacterium]|nr:TraR/DksA C4-type zinc finger protein [Actinomycetota bacterium]